MGGFEIVIYGILAVSVLIGYHVGFLRVVYSLVAWILVLAFVTWATPYLTSFLEENTALKPSIQEKCMDYMENLAGERIEQGVEEYGENPQGSLKLLPESVLEGILGSASGAIGGILQNSGIYEEVSGVAAHFILQGISFFGAMLVAGLISHMILRLLNGVSNIPALKKGNKVLGAVAGGVKGLLIVWLILGVIAICAAWGISGQLLERIEGNWLLHILYQRNLLLEVVLLFLK